VGYFFDLRLCVKNLPLTQLISNSDVFEDLDYRYPINLENRHEIELQFNKNSRFTGLLVWLTLHTDTEHMVDILTEQSSWLPVYLPLFIDGKSVKTGDRLVATITRQLCDNHFNPDYLLEGALYRQGQPTLPIHYHSYHFKPHYRVHPFYQKLFADDKVPVLPKLDAKMFRDYLSQYLPDYMVPSTFTVLDRLPLTPNGKIDRKALPALDSNTPTENTLPRDSIELQLLCMWETVLDRQKIGIHDNFFELGGHSLLAIRLMAEIQQQFGQNLSLASLFQGATIEQLAKIIRQQTDSQSWSPLVAIQPHGSKPPFFCMPGSGGNVIYFHQLARHLGTEQPFYALQARGLDGESAPLTCVEDIADYYLEAIRTVQPQGPYLLGGHSFGAIVAFEMAQRLHRQGKKVALLALLDLPALLPDRQPIELDWDDTKWMATIAHVLESLSGKTLGLSSEDFQALDADAQLTLLSASLERVNLLPVDAGINTVRGIAQVIKADELAFLRYVPPTGYSNQITLFKTGDVYQDELGMLNEEIPNDPAWGWGRLSTEPVEVIMVPGNHTTVLTEPHVQVLAEKLRECLDKV
jgi:thioesterase domain-containing protein/acyl carrier protein